MSSPWNAIPRNLHPKTANDQRLLLSIADAVREAALIRHDFQTTLSMNTRERSLRPVAMESQFGKLKGRTARELAQEHIALLQKVRWRISRLDNAVLKAYLTPRIAWLFPDIGWSDSMGGLKRLRRPESVRDQINPLLSDVDLLQVLHKLDREPIDPHAIIKKRIAPVPARDANYF